MFVLLLDLTNCRLPISDLKVCGAGRTSLEAGLQRTPVARPGSVWGTRLSAAIVCHGHPPAGTG
jgi:hypothetical protein